MNLRPYQEELVSAASEALFKKNHRSVLLQAPTGTGKTAIFSDILSKLSAKKKKAWVIVPRKEILSQASQSLLRWKTNHGIIAPGRHETGAYDVHVVSGDTLIRRYDKIKNFPDYIIFDEAHIFLDRQLEIAEKFNQARFIGFTATPERMDGRGLSKSAGGIYDSMVESYSIPWFTERDYLVPLWYYKPPIEGIDKLHLKGTETDAGELDELLEKYKVYGEVIEHYRLHADKKPALVFCRDVKSAYKTAEKFRQAGYEFYCIEGKMSDKERRGLLDGLRTGRIHGLTNCEIATYGLDIPRVEVGICLRPTLSRELYMQMIGRIIRPYTGKDKAIFIDHVNNVYEHQEEAYPGVPLHHVPHIKWNFDGTEKRKRRKKDEEELSLKYCPSCSMYFEGATCPYCGAAARQRTEKKQEQINVSLQVVVPQKLEERPPDERREFIDKINAAAREFYSGADDGKILPGPVGEMLKLAEHLGRPVLWVYWKLSTKNKHTVNVSLLSEIARQKNYKKGWVFFQKGEIAKKIRTQKAEIEEAATEAGLFG